MFLERHPILPPVHLNFATSERICPGLLGFLETKPYSNVGQRDPQECVDDLGHTGLPLAILKEDGRGRRLMINKGEKGGVLSRFKSAGLIY
jgi:hypothetical protein